MKFKFILLLIIALVGVSKADYEYLVDETTLLPCASPAPDNDVSWMRKTTDDGIDSEVPLIENQYKKVSDAEGVNYLVIRSLKLSDNGVYKCFLKGETTPISEITLTVHPKYRITSEIPEKLVIPRNGNATLWCKGVGPPGTSSTWISWYRAGSKKSKKGVKISENGTRVDLANFDNDENALSSLDCQVTSDLYPGGDYKAVKEIVHPEETINDPKITNVLRDRTVKEGESASFTCGSKFPEHNITWMEGRYTQTPLETSELWKGHFSVELEDPGFSVLELVNLNRSHSGSIVCNVRNSLGKEVTAMADLNVKYEKNIDNATTKDLQYLAAGQRGSIRVQTDVPDGGYDAVCAEWFKDGKSFKLDDYAYYNRLVLEFEEAKYSDEGVYHVQLKGRRFSCDGEGQTSKGITVKVGEAPVFISRPKGIYRVKEGNDLSVPCKALGTPQLTQSWKRSRGFFGSDSETVPVDDPNLLIIKNVSRVEHNYTPYACVAKSAGTESSRSFRIFVTSDTPTPPPTNLSITPISIEGEKVNLTFVSQAKHCVVTHCNAKFRILVSDVADPNGEPKTVGHFFEFKQGQDEAPQVVTIKDLQPDTEYKVQVMEMSAIGDHVITEGDGLPASITFRTDKVDVVQKIEKERKSNEERLTALERKLEQLEQRLSNAIG